MEILIIKLIAALPGGGLENRTKSMNSPWLLTA